MSQTAMCTQTHPLKPSQNSCDGTWGLVVLSPQEPDELVVACNGSPMVLGIGEGRVFIASETSAFNRHTKNFIALKVRQFCSSYLYQ